MENKAWEEREEPDEERARKSPRSILSKLIKLRFFHWLLAHTPYKTYQPKPTVILLPPSCKNIPTQLLFSLSSLLLPGRSPPEEGGEERRSYLNQSDTLDNDLKLRGGGGGGGPFGPNGGSIFPPLLGGRKKAKEEEGKKTP